MKKNLLLVVSLLVCLGVFAKKTSIEFKVYGSCGMCEKRIEKAAKSVNGVSVAEWNSKTQMLEIVFNTKKTYERQIHDAVAKVGHDTDKVKAKDEVYNNLHACCKYKRPEAKKACGSKKKSCCGH